MATSNDFDSVLRHLSRYGQEHLLTFWNELSDNYRDQLLQDISEIDFERFGRDVDNARKIHVGSSVEMVDNKIDETLQPPSADICGSWSTTSSELLKHYKQNGLKFIATGKYCAILLAGGAGTRLGINYPKGMFSVGLPSGKSLFQIQAERIRRLQIIVTEKFGKCPPLTWFIMTSDCTKEATMDYFRRNSYFGLLYDQVIFFEQFKLPVIDVNGKILLESKWRILKSPDGNGGLYYALQKNRIIDQMKQRGIEYAFVYSVDNILVKVADPVFLGFVLEKNAECAVKVVEKIDPFESVGIVGKINGRYHIVEYSEISRKTVEKIDLKDSEVDGSKLLYRKANVCMHLLRLDFLERVCCMNFIDRMPQHVAQKTVMCFNVTNGDYQNMEIPCLKLEKFIFDVFPFVNDGCFAVWEVERIREFSALKNGQGAGSDCPETARLALLEYGKILVMENVRDEGLRKKVKEMVVELSPLLSYAGEGLEGIEEVLGHVIGNKTVYLEKVDGRIKVVARW